MKFLFFSLIFAALLETASGNTQHSSLVLYTDIDSVNRTDSLHKLRQLPFKSFTFVYDKVPNRRQVGVLASDAFRFFPESVEIVAQHTLIANKSAPPITLNNFPVVDKSVLFMHGLVTLQELLSRLDSHGKTIEELTRLQNNFVTIYQSADAMLKGDISEKTKLKLQETAIRLEVAQRIEQETQREKQRETELANAEIEHERALFAYEEELAKSRLSFQEKLSRESFERSIELETKLSEARELMRKENSEKLEKIKKESNAELESRRSDFELKKIKTEIEAKAEQERANEDMRIRYLQEQAKLDTQRTIVGIQMVSEQVVTVIREFLSRPKQIAILAGSFGAIFIVYTMCIQFIAILKEFLQSKLGRPSLVRETSFKFNLVPSFISSLWGFMKPAGLRDIQTYFHDVVLSPADMDRVVSLAQSTRNTKATGAPYRHVLLYGPPGTGKTLVARKLAQCSGMDYAIMSGGDVGPLGEHAVDQLNELFAWANRSSRGLLLFIDEAEAFLSARKSAVNSTGAGNDAFIRYALNALLHQTGTQSKKLMLILATNRPEDLDAAVLDRIDISILFGLPEQAQRFQLIKLYMEKFVNKIAIESQVRWRLSLRRSPTYRVDSNCLDDECYGLIAARSKEFSGREISKLCIAVQYAMLLSSDRLLTRKVLFEVIDMKINEHAEKKRFNLLAPEVTSNDRD